MPFEFIVKEIILTQKKKKRKEKDKHDIKYMPFEYVELRRL